MRTLPYRLTMTALSAALLFGCGDDDGMMLDSGPGLDGGPGADVGLDAPEGGDTITDVAAGNPDFSILVGALQRTGLDTVLSGAGPFTVFAPANAAFDGIDLDAIPDDVLAQILQNHVIIGAAVASDAIPATADNAADLTLIFDTSSGVSVNGSSVSTPDVSASNGVIHMGAAGLRSSLDVVRR